MIAVASGESVDVALAADDEEVGESAAESEVSGAQVVVQSVDVAARPCTSAAVPQIMV